MYSMHSVSIHIGKILQIFTVATAVLLELLLKYLTEGTVVIESIIR